MIEINDIEYPQQKCWNYTINEQEIKDNYLKIKQKFFPQNILDTTGTNIVNPFDLHVLKCFCEANNIKRVTELGCGSTSKLMDSMGIQRLSFAKHDASFQDISFKECDIYESFDEILAECKQSDLFIIDSIHNTQMAHFYVDILKQIDIPVFFHDWFLPGEDTFSEQNYWIENILEKLYKIDIVTRVVNIKGYQFHPMVPCSVIFTKI